MIADLCKKHNVLCLADEVYEWLVYKPAEHVRIGEHRVCVFRIYQRLRHFSRVILSAPILRVFRTSYNVDRNEREHSIRESVAFLKSVS